jgi:cellulose synthase/poly-beta-1,6-N-acetylglucosamine synthase-like glycosyltransferase
MGPEPGGAAAGGSPPPLMAEGSVISTCNDDVPQDGSEYFQQLSRTLRRTAQDVRKVIGMCIPCFNEERFSLENTLNSLYKMEVPRDFVVEVIILMDGVLGPTQDKPGQELVPSDSMRQFLRKNYGVDWARFDEGGGAQQTTIFQSTGPFQPSRGGPARENIRVSLLQKKKNQRKHNSHQWFMQSFARELNCKYIFCTDCATVFDKDMLAKLTAHLEDNPTTTAVCGRQRVMAAEIQHRQGSGEPKKRDTWKEYILRQIQTYDFEADAPVSKAAYDWLGFLPVLPGPCGLYRYADLNDGRLQRYFEIITPPAGAPPCGLWKSNLKIAEDRIPSLLAVFFPDRPQDNFETHYVRDAVFYFEAELTVRDLVLQRRRWLNGTLAGYIYTMLHIRSYVWKSGHSMWMKLLTTLMILVQLLQSVILALAPGIFASILNSSVRFVTAHYIFPDSSEISLAEHAAETARCVNPTAVDGMPWETVQAQCDSLPQCTSDADCHADTPACWASVCDPHHEHRRCGLSWQDADQTCGYSCKVDSDCDQVSGEQCFANLGPPHRCSTRVVGFVLLVCQAAIPVAFAIIDMPFSGTNLKINRSPILMARSILWYVLFMPTFIGFFSAYSLNRLDDVSWGQRDTGDGPRSFGFRIRCQAILIRIVIPILNLTFAVAMCVLRVVAPKYVEYGAYGIMAVSGFAFVVALLSYVSKYASTLFKCCTEGRLCGDETKNNGALDRLFASSVTSDVHEPLV